MKHQYSLFILTIILIVNYNPNYKLGCWAITKTPRSLSRTRHHLDNHHQHYYQYRHHDLHCPHLISHLCHHHHHYRHYHCPHPSLSIEHNHHIHCSHHHHRNCFPNMKKKSRSPSTSLTGTTMARSATDLCRWLCIQFRQQKSDWLHRKCFCKMFSYLNS